VCICTYKRPASLSRLLNKLADQTGAGLYFRHSIVVADNDASESARQIVGESQKTSPLPVTYCLESRKNIALVRNKAIANSHGEFIAFIDDDEFPVPQWLELLIKAQRDSGADGVLGPVNPFFDYTPPKWAIRGRFFERPRHENGFRIRLSDARTGNVLLRRSLFANQAEPFLSQFNNGGEDVDFFRRMMAKGHVFIWCDEAIAYEEVTVSRCSRSYLLKRALLRGRNSLKQRSGFAMRVAKSAVAVPLYAVALPFLWLAGEHHFLRYLISFCDHAGRLLALANLNPVKERDL